MKQIKFVIFAFPILLLSCSSDDGEAKNTSASESIEQYLADNSLTFTITSEGAYQYVKVSDQSKMSGRSPLPQVDSAEVFIRSQTSLAIHILCNVRLCRPINFHL